MSHCSSMLWRTTPRPTIFTWESDFIVVLRHKPWWYPYVSLRVKPNWSLHATCFFLEGFCFRNLKNLGLQLPTEPFIYVMILEKPYYIYFGVTSLLFQSTENPNQICYSVSVGSVHTNTYNFLYGSAVGVGLDDGSQVFEMTFYFLVAKGRKQPPILFFFADEFAHVGLCPKPFKRTVVVTNETQAPPFLEIWKREKKWWKQTDINDWATFWGQTCAARVLWTQLATRRDFQVRFGEKKIWQPGSSSLRPAFNFFLTGWLLLLLSWAGQRRIYSDDSTTSKMFSANCSHWAIQFCWLDRPIAWDLTSPSAKISRITTSRIETFVSEQSICHHWKLAIVSCESTGRQLSSVNKHLINWLPYRIVFAQFSRCFGDHTFSVRGNIFVVI